MKTSGHLILYISENEDYELWKILTQISPEERAAFVKNALRKAIAQNSSKKSNNSGLYGNSVLKNRTSEKNASTDFQLAATEERDEEEINGLEFDDVLLSSEIAEDNNSLPGLNFLLNNVIGEEDDEMVIEFLKNRITVNEEKA